MDWIGTIRHQSLILRWKMNIPLFIAFVFFFITGCRVKCGLSINSRGNGTIRTNSLPRSPSQSLETHRRSSFARALSSQLNRNPASVNPCQKFHIPLTKYRYITVETVHSINRHPIIHKEPPPVLQCTWHI